MRNPHESRAYIASVGGEQWCSAPAEGARHERAANHAHDTEHAGAVALVRGTRARHLRAVLPHHGQRRHGIRAHHRAPTYRARCRRRSQRAPDRRRAGLAGGAARPTRSLRQPVRRSRGLASIAARARRSRHRQGGRGPAVTRSPFWNCHVCGAQNHEIDGECQFCECGGADCERDNCSDPRHFECQGHPSGPYDPMGVTVYCDGSCRQPVPSRSNLARGAQ